MSASQIQFIRRAKISSGVLFIDSIRGMNSSKRFERKYLERIKDWSSSMESRICPAKQGTIYKKEPLTTCFLSLGRILEL